MSIVVDNELEQLREYEKKFQWCKENYDYLYSKYKNEWIAINYPPKVYHNKDFDKLRNRLINDNLDTSNIFIEFIKDKDIQYI